MEVERTVVRLPPEEKFYIFFEQSWGAVGPTQPHIQWLSGAFYRGSEMI